MSTADDSWTVFWGKTNVQRRPLTLVEAGLIRKTDIERRPAFHIVKVLGDGDCLFRCVSRIVQCLPLPIKQETCVRMARHLGLRQMVDLNKLCTTRVMRALVAGEVLDPTLPTTREAMQTWVSVFKSAYEEKDESLLKEYAFVAPVVHDKDVMRLSARQMMYNGMMNKDVYWGNEFAIQVLSHLLRIRIRVVNDKGDEMKTVEMNGVFLYDAYVRLKANHYDIVCDENGCVLY